jgi:SAM-dependent methyltransferase
MKSSGDVQVSKEHYQFETYVGKQRWASYWTQINEILKQQHQNILSIGVGDGIVTNILRNSGKNVVTFDIDPELVPDVVGSVIKLPFDNSSFDIVCAFQVLEHLPYDDSVKALNELLRVSKHSVIISLPNQKPVRQFHLSFPFIRQFRLLLSNPFWVPKIHNFDGEHYWEINAKNYELKRIEIIFNEIAKAKDKNIFESFRLYENPYHHFFIFR